MLIVTAFPKAAVLGDTEGVVALGIVVPVNVPLTLALPSCTPELNDAEHERESEPFALCVCVNEPEAIVFELPLLTPLTSNDVPEYLFVPPMVTLILAPPLLHEGDATSIFTFSDHEIFPAFVAADVPDSLTSRTSCAQPELKFFVNVAIFPPIPDKPD